MPSNKRCPYEAYVTKYCYTCGSSHAGLQPIPKPTRRRPTDTERLDFWLRSGGGLIFVPRAAIPKDEIQYVHTRTELDKLMKRARLMREEAKRG